MKENIFHKADGNFGAHRLVSPPLSQGKTSFGRSNSHRGLLLREQPPFRPSTLSEVLRPIGRRSSAFNLRRHNSKQRDRDNSRTARSPAYASAYERTRGQELCIAIGKGSKSVEGIQSFHATATGETAQPFDVETFEVVASKLLQRKLLLLSCMRCSTMLEMRPCPHGVPPFQAIGLDRMSSDRCGVGEEDQWKGKLTAGHFHFISACMVDHVVDHVEAAI